MKNVVVIPTVKSRNFLVVPTLFRKAGKHEKPEKTKRKLNKQNFMRDINFY